MSTFKLPDLGEGLAEAEILEWHVKPGDHVLVDQPMVSVETAKAVVEVPVPYAGTVIALHGAVGDIVADRRAADRFRFRHRRRQHAGDERGGVRRIRHVSRTRGNGAGAATAAAAAAAAAQRARPRGADRARARAPLRDRSWEHRGQRTEGLIKLDDVLEQVQLPGRACALAFRGAESGSSRRAPPSSRCAARGAPWRTACRCRAIRSPLSTVCDDADIHCVVAPRRLHAAAHARHDRRLARRARLERLVRCGRKLAHSARAHRPRDRRRHARRLDRAGAAQHPGQDARRAARGAARAKSRRPRAQHRAGGSARLHLDAVEFRYARGALRHPAGGASRGRDPRCGQGAAGCGGASRAPSWRIGACRCR